MERREAERIEAIESEAGRRKAEDEEHLRWQARMAAAWEEHPLNPKNRRPPRPEPPADSIRGRVLRRIGRTEHGVGTRAETADDTGETR